MDNQITPELLQRYAQGLCTLDEARRVEQWLEQESDPFGELGDPTGEGDPALRDQIWQSLNAASGRRVAVWRYWRVAASIVLVSALAAGAYVGLRQAPATRLAHEKTIKAPAGGTSVLRFPDGSVVWLQGGGEISFTEPFRPDARSVALLRGKALFEIHHDPKHPFAVATGGSRIQVLGTRFVVSRETGGVQVTLANGKVRFVTDRNQVEELKPGYLLDYNALSGEVERVAPADTGYATAWTRQVLWFRQTPLSEVMEEIGRTYGVSFTAAPEVDLSRRMNGKFEKQPLSRVLRLLALSTGYDFSVKNNEVVIR